MGLTASLNLDTRSLGTTLLGDLAGPAGNLNAVVAPAPGARLDGVASLSGNIDTGAVLASLAHVAERALPIIGSMPDVGAVLGTLNDILTRIEGLTQQEFGSGISTLFVRLADELAQFSPEEGRIAAVLHLLDALGRATEGGAVREVLTTFTARAGINLPSASSYVDALRALDGVVGALGGMMALESVLSEAERLSRTMAATTTPAVLTEGLAAIDAALRGEGTSLAALVSGVDANDAPSVNAAINAVVGVADRFAALQEQFTAALGMGEATLVYLDVARLQSEIDTARGMVRTADLEPLRRLAAAVAPALQPFMALDLGALPAGNLGALVARLESEVAAIAAGIAAVDPAGFVSPLTDGIRTITAPLREANRLVAEATVALRAALDQVRAAVAALPFQAVADALRTFLAPIAQVLDAIRALLAEIESALNTAAGAATTALNQIDGALTTFKNAIDGLFAQAKTAVESVKIEEVLGAVGQNVQAFADLLGQAQMQPYFDTAAGAINAATSVVSAVPFGLLPESMKADVDAAVKPIKETDVEAEEQAIESVLGITADGKFAVRGDIEAAIADIRTQFLALIKLVEDNDPRKLLQQVDEKLKEIAEKVSALSPELTLKPVADAIDSVKQVIRGIDLDGALQPVRDVFTQIDAALDRYSPSQLVAPLEERIAAARGAVVDLIRLDRWVPALDDAQTRALSLLDMASPARVRELLDEASAEVMTLLERFPEADTTRGFGTMIAGLLAPTTGLRVYPTSFPVVATWIGGASGTAALAAHADAVGEAFGATKDAVEKMDFAAAGAAVITGMTALRTAVQGLIARLAAGSGEALRLTALLPRLEVTVSVAGLTRNRARYLASLTEAVRQVDQFRRTGFSEVDATLAEFRAALQPLRPAWLQLQRVMAAMGIDPQHLSVAGVVRAVLREMTPQRLADVLMPLFEAFRGRVAAVLSAVIAPLKDAANELTTLVNALDLAPLAQAADAAVQEVKEQIHRLSPDELLKEPLQSFAQLKDALIAHDPLAAVTTILTALRDLMARVLERLSLEKLLESPLAIYDHILGELKKLDPSALLDPIFDQIDEIALQVDTGLDQTVEAFKGLQAALPGGGGGSSVSVTASVG